MKECSKSISRRLREPNFINKFFVGKGLDIGGKPDPLSLYAELFNRIESIKTWDLEDGDAQFLDSLPDESYDFIHSSHCLEHLNDPYEGLRNWVRVVKKGGYIIITVPDEDLYEQGVFPSKFNLDHKFSFTIFKKKSWSEKSVNIIDLIKELGADVELVKLELLNSTYRYKLPRYDQTITPVGECGIEIVIRRRLDEEIEKNYHLSKDNRNLSDELKVHLNQYKDDIKAMKENNKSVEPFTNLADI